MSSEQFDPLLRVLIGYDGSDAGCDAVELARILMKAGDEALLVNVLPYPGSLPVAYQLLGSDVSPDATDFFNEAVAALSGFDAHTRSYIGGSPARVLTDLAENEEFDAVVVGSPHRGALGRALVGSVAQELLHGASRPTIVAPKGYARERHEHLRRIGAAVDGTRESEAAQRQAEVIALANSAELEILTVDRLVEPVAGVISYTFDLPADGATTLDQALRRADDRLRIRGRLLGGDPIACALAEACEGEIDLLVVGSRGYGPVSRVLLGSVSTQLIREAPCPVLVVPRPMAEHDEADERNPETAHASQPSGV